jgi:hypothetical protein
MLLICRLHLRDMHPTKLNVSLSKENGKMKGQAWDQFSKTFYGHNLQFFRNKLECLSVEGPTRLV